MNLRFLLAITVIMATAGAFAQQVSFSGNTKEVYDAPVDNNTGLNHLYVLYSAQNVAMTYTAADPSEDVTWYKYKEMGGSYATEVDVTHDGMGQTTLNPVEADCGYIIEEGTTRTYLWVADYQNALINLKGLSFGEMGDCGTATLLVDGSGEDIVYYTITGVRRVLNRGMKLKYYTRAWNEEEYSWNEQDLAVAIENFKNTIVVQAPLCNTTFTLEGDDLLDFWHEQHFKAVSDEYKTIAVDAKTFAEQEERKNDNEQKNPDTNILGGSAPVNVTFTAYPTDAVVYREWQMSTDPNFENLDLRLNQDVVEQEFTEAGTYYWRYIAANDDNSCDFVSDTYTVSIGESVLECPNVFSPGTTEGINDIWKVSYKSIVDFHCAIFSRYGVKVAEFTNPGDGWDGRYHGKLVKAGVYFYVITARGADGKPYNLSGDINIIRFKKNLSTSGDPNEPDPNPGDPVDHNAE